MLLFVIFVYFNQISQTKQFQQMTTTNIFLSYAQKDEDYKNKLLDHLKNLERQGHIRAWDASQIVAGSTWKTQREQQLENADIALLLISPDAIADDYIYENEIQKALQNAESGKQIIVPILIRPVNYQGLDIEKYLVLPSNGKAVSEWNNPDKAYEHIVQHLQKIIEKPQQLLAGDVPKEMVKDENTTSIPSPEIPKSKFWQYLAMAGLVVSILAGIAEFTGYSLKDIFASSTPTSKALTEPFDITVFVHSEGNPSEPILKQKGNVTMNFSGDKRSEPIDHDGKASFRNIPIAKANDSVLFNIDFSEPYRPTQPQQKHALQPFTDIYLEVALQGLDKVFGTVLYKDAPLAEVEVSIGKLQTTTDKRGYYELPIPKDQQRQKQSVQFYKEGYKLQTKTATPQTQKELRVIMEKLR